MPNDTTLAEVDQLAATLTPQQQIQLIADVSQRLSREPLVGSAGEPSPADHATRVEAFVRMGREMAARASGDVDSAADIRQARQQRASQL